MHADLSLEQHLRQLEEQLLKHGVRKSAADVAALLANDFVEFGSSGQAFDKKHLIEELQTESPIHRSLMDFKAVLLAHGVALATYRTVSHGTPGKGPVYSLRSSIWKLKDGHWQMVFHQGTLSKEA